MGNDNNKLENKVNFNQINLRKSIKSTFILKKIFSILDENIKLNMIKYNKNYQKLFGFNIEYYKEISGRYMVGDRNGKGEEYDFDNIKIFEGEYLNGLKNGKGKEYYKTGELRFEGEYLNGYPKNGKGYTGTGKLFFILYDNRKFKAFYPNSKSEFFGEFINGKIYNVKKYNYLGNLEFEVKYGCGKGIEILDDKSIYEGEYFNGKRNGKGMEYYYYSSSKIKYIGEYLNGKRHGKGKEYYENGEIKFEGDYLNGDWWNGRGYNVRGFCLFKLNYGKGMVEEYHENDSKNINNNFEEEEEIRNKLKNDNYAKKK